MVPNFRGAEGTSQRQQFPRPTEKKEWDFLLYRYIMGNIPGALDLIDVLYFIIRINLKRDESEWNDLAVKGIFWSTFPQVNWQWAYPAVQGKRPVR